MTNRTWADTTGSHLASDPANWTPAVGATSSVAVNNAASAASPTGSATASSSVSNSTATVANAGTTPTPLTPAEGTAVTVAAGVNRDAGGAMVFCYDGVHVAHDFDTLGSVISSGQDQTPVLNQCLADLKQLLSAYANEAGPFAAGVDVPGIPGQFVVDVVNSSLKAMAIGDAGLDHAYAGALNQFFNSEASVTLGMAH